MYNEILTYTSLVVVVVPKFPYGAQLLIKKPTWIGEGSELVHEIDHGGDWLA